MKLEKEEKEQLIGIASLAISAFFVVQSALIPMSRYSFIASARIFPLLVSIVMALISAGYIVRSYRMNGGWVRPSKVAAAVRSFVLARETRQIVTAMALVFVYYLLAAAKGRFYLVSAVFLVFISWAYVKEGKLWRRIVGVILTVAACYLLFYRGFQVQLY